MIMAMLTVSVERTLHTIGRSIAQIERAIKWRQVIDRLSTSPVWLAQQTSGNTQVASG